MKWYLALSILAPFTACLREAPPYTGNTQPSQDPNSSPTKNLVNTSELEFDFREAIGLAVVGASEKEEEAYSEALRLGRLPDLNFEGTTNLRKLLDNGHLTDVLAQGQLYVSRFKISPKNEIIALIPQSLDPQAPQIGVGELCSLLRIRTTGNADCIDKSGDKVQWRENNEFGGPANASVQFDKQGNIYYIIQRNMGGLNEGRIQSVLRKYRITDGKVIDMFRAPSLLDDFVVHPSGNIFISGLGDITKGNSWFRRLGAGSNMTETRLIVETRIAETAPRFMKMVQDPKTKSQQLMVGIPGQAFGSDANDAFNFLFRLAMIAAEGYLMYQTGGASALLGPLLGNLMGGGNPVPGKSFGSSPISNVISLIGGGGTMGVGGGSLFDIFGGAEEASSDVEDAEPVYGGLIVRGSKVKDRRQLMYWDSLSQFSQHILVDQNVDIREDWSNPHGDRIFFAGVDPVSGQKVLGEVDLKTFVGRVIEDSPRDILDLEFFNN